MTTATNNTLLGIRAEHIPLPLVHAPAPPGGPGAVQPGALGEPGLAPVGGEEQTTVVFQSELRRRLNEGLEPGALGPPLVLTRQVADGCLRAVVNGVHYTAAVALPQ